MALIDPLVGRDHIRAHWCRRSWAETIEGMLDETIRWSVNTSKLISAGEEPPAPTEDEEPPPPSRPLARGVRPRRQTMGELMR